VCEDSFRTVTIAVNQGSAAAILRARRGDPLVLSRVPQEAAALPPAYDAKPSLTPS
jgi:hypothetical protein